MRYRFPQSNTRDRDLLTNKIEDIDCSKPYFKAYHSFADVRLQLYCLSLTFNLETFFRFHLEFFHRLLPATRLPYSTKIRKPVSIKTISDNLSSLLHLHFNLSSLSPSSSNPFRLGGGGGGGPINWEGNRGGAGGMGLFLVFFFIFRWRFVVGV